MFRGDLLFFLYTSISYILFTNFFHSMLISMFHEHVFFRNFEKRIREKNEGRKGNFHDSIEIRHQRILHIFFLQILDEGKEISLEKETKEMISLPIDN